MTATRLFAAALATLALAAAQRSVVTLNYGVRTAPDTAPAPQCNTSIYVQSLANQRCMGLSSASASDAATCQLAACLAGAQCWQWLASQGCWVGSPDSCSAVSTDDGPGRAVTGRPAAWIASTSL